jgi:arsenate-mycothiol transferase
MTQPPPSVLFVCVKNAGKSQMAAGLMRRAAGSAVAVASAGTAPGSAVNALSAQALAEVGVDITAQVPQPVTDDLLRTADLVVVLGREAELAVEPGTRVVRWETDEPSERGIEGLERMRRVRDDIDARTRALAADLGAAAGRPAGT